MNVSGSSESARTLGDDVIKCVSQVVNETGNIDSKLKELGRSFKDEEYEDIKNAIEKVQKATMDVLETLKAIKPKLDRYAAILDEASLKLS